MLNIKEIKKNSLTANLIKDLVFLKYNIYHKNHLYESLVEFYILPKENSHACTINYLMRILDSDDKTIAKFDHEQQVIFNIKSKISGLRVDEQDKVLRDEIFAKAEKVELVSS